MFKIFLFLIASLPLCAQMSRPTDRQTLIEQTTDFFVAMRSADTARLSAMLHPGASLATVADGQVRNQNFDGFLDYLGKRTAVLDERIYSFDAQTDGDFGSVWTRYALYVDGVFSHCGINQFDWIRTDAAWKILHITNTRRKASCWESPQAQIDSLLDRWHEAAARADAETFFGSMTADAVYLGTDAEERWLRDELRAWSAEYFTRESAWAFRPIVRKVQLSEDLRLAWFDEKLDTWMGICIGSGVLRYTPEGWRLVHYHLAFAVPNAAMPKVLDLLKGAKD